MIYVCKICGHKSRYHRNEPDGYDEWQRWANKMVKTHHQEQCPDCGNFTIWKKGPPESLIYEFE
jgi:ribosomal protein L32